MKAPLMGSTLLTYQGTKAVLIFKTNKLINKDVDEINKSKTGLSFFLLKNKNKMIEILNKNNNRQLK